MNDIKVDERHLLEMFSSLSSKKMKNTYKSALSKAARILVKQAKDNLKKVTAKFNSKTTNLKNGWHIKTKKNGQKKIASLQDGIKYRIEDGAQSAKVHIMGDFRLKFFEKGTKERILKKNGAKRGKINGSYFFKSAQQDKEQEIFSNIERLISESIQRTANRNN